ncbi:MAG: aminotransferase class IV [Mariprofundaceae bacterium]
MTKLNIQSAKLNIQNVTLLDRGIAYAEACFETFRVINGAVFEAHEHQYRLQQGVADLGLQLDDQATQDIWKVCLEAASKCAPDALIRVTVTGGDAPWGLLSSVDVVPNVYIQAQAFKPDKAEIHLQCMPWPYAPKNKHAKFTSDYAETLRCLRSWQHDLAALETPLICFEEQMLSAMTANVFIYRNGQWFTPSKGVLQGIVRKVLLDAKLVKPCLCPVSWLDDCEAIALINSGMFIRAVSSIHGRALDVDHASIIELKQLLKGSEGVPEL